MPQVGDGPTLFDGERCPMCGEDVEAERLDDGRVKYVHHGNDHTYGRIESR